MANDFCAIRLNPEQDADLIIMLENAPSKTDFIKACMRKTILHYAKKIKEYCISHKCDKCELSKGDKICYFFSFPYNWEEVNLHDE